MKRKLAILMVTAISGITLAGCGKGKAADNAASTAASDSAATVAATVVDPLGEDAYLDYYNVTDYVTLGEYKGVEVEVTPFETTDKDVLCAITAAYKSVFVPADTDRKEIQIGDTANIDFTGKYADTKEAFENGSGTGYDLVIGSGSFIDGFEDKLVGVKVGETVDLDLTFPEQYQSAELAGKDVIFTVTVNSIKAPEYTKEQIASLGLEGVTDFEGLKAFVKSDLEAAAEEERNSLIENQAVKAAYKNCTFTGNYPQPLVDRFVRQFETTMNSIMYYYQSMQGVQAASVDEFITVYFGIDASEVPSFKIKRATEQLEYSLMEAAIAQQENLMPTEADVTAKKTEVASTGYSGSEPFEDYYLKTYGMDITKLASEQLMYENAIAFMQDNAKIVEVDELSEEAEEIEEEAEELEEEATEAEGEDKKG